MSYLSTAQNFSKRNIQTPINKKQRIYLEKHLLEWKEALLAKITNQTDFIKNQNIEIGDNADKARVEEEIAISLAESSQGKKLIERINAALNNINNERFGFCNSCDVPIGFKRLAAHPIATECIECKTLSEVKESH